MMALMPAEALAQRYFSLTTNELHIDSVVPLFTFAHPLGPEYRDSLYTVSIEYPEFQPMKRKQARRYKKLTGEPLPEWPVVDSYIGTVRKQGNLYASFVPFVRRDGKNLMMTNFKITVHSEEAHLQKAHPQLLPCREGRSYLDDENGTSLANGFSKHTTPLTAKEGQGVSPLGLLQSDYIVKISVPATGIYELSDSLLAAAGFEQPEHVSVYGYGGALQPEALSQEYLSATDQLPEVPLCSVNGRRLFHAVGPVNWEKPDSEKRIRNPYSNVGCYFITESDGEPLTVDSAQFAATFYPSANDYHTLYEVDDFAWLHGGRNLFDERLFGMNVARSYRLPTEGRREGIVSIVMSYAGYCEATVHLGDSLLGNIVINKTTTVSSKQGLDTYMKAASDVWTFSASNLPQDSAVITIRQTSGANMRLDNIELCFTEPAPMPALSTTAFAQPTVIGKVAPQQLHADGAADMVIIVPASGKLTEQAERLAQLHRDADGLRVKVVRADELYNEFSSGTPDVAAYRRYLKMLYDRTDNEADMPRFLILFGDAAYDNRLNTSDFSHLSADDLLLCYESENSVSTTACYVTDDFFGYLDDGEGADIIKTDKTDVAVGRLPVRTAEEAKDVVDKIISYRNNDYAGAWQNTICFMGDDGNANMHMNDADAVAEMVLGRWPDYNVKKIHWDAYERTNTGEGNTYPDVTRLILQQMHEGALLMNYSGHGGPRVLSHERVVFLSDFKKPTSQRLPLWFTASCEVAPFDGHLENIGEQSLINRNGGAIAFVGTTRTVYALHNRSLNTAFTKHLLDTADGTARPIGEALRMAKNDQVLGPKKTQLQAGINKLHFVLLGDPALSLPLPTAHVVIDSINGCAVTDGCQHLLAGDTASVSGHITSITSPLTPLSSFNGVATLTVKDALQTITCRMNPLDASEMPRKPLEYTDRPSTLFTGSDSIIDGRFRITFAVPKDISYSDSTGLMLVHAVSSDHQQAAHGSSEAFTMGSAEAYAPEGEGPLVTAWLDSPDFIDGSHVSCAPLLHAELYDEDGINASDSGIGHDVVLVIDGLARYTYNLKGYFSFNFGDYRCGSISYQLPALDDGHHMLQLRAWDVLNNSSVTTLTFATGPQNAPSGISELSPHTSHFSPLYDLQGRLVKSPTSRQLLLMRSQDGKVKKKLFRKQ
ncbi:MAG: type IX secretion system sortase PorU [Prevotella sp.]|nr:type IX secretion system sortase PorU [Prevotella sp.]